METVHQEGAHLIAQLMHAGGQSQGNAYTEDTIAPSENAPKGEQLGFTVVLVPSRHQRK